MCVSLLSGSFVLMTTARTDSGLVRELHAGAFSFLSLLVGFLERFAQHDNLGIVSSLRLMWADFLEEGPLHGHCIGLAELASAAVDYRYG